MKRQSILFRPFVQLLEQRLQPDNEGLVTLSNGILQIEGTDAADTILVRQQDTTVRVTLSTLANGSLLVDFPAEQIQRISIHAWEGNDRIDLRQTPVPSQIWSGKENDQIIGGPANDFIIAGSGNDQVNGGGGDDTLLGSHGNDWLDGQSGDDIVLGDYGRDTLYGGTGHDQVHGGFDNDWLFGGEGHDTLEGLAGQDRLEGNAGNDRLIGGDGNDTLRGGAHQDLFFGGPGSDRLMGGVGLDRLQAAPNDVVFEQDYNPRFGYGALDANAALSAVWQRDGFLDAVADLGGPHWNLDQIQAPEVWAHDIDGSGVVVAVLDTGVQYNNLDLDDNIWRNLGEVPGDGIDNDGNGFVDDVHGWDFAEQDAQPTDVHGHGTHVAGTIAAENNGIQTIGVAPKATIMPVKVLSDGGWGTWANVSAGIRYAAANGADVINMSLSGNSGTPEVQEAIQFAHAQGVVVVMAASNDGESQPDFPARYADQWGMAVGAIDQDGVMAYFSNRAGLSPLDYIVAPGVGVWSIDLHNSKDRFSPWNGTSMATPHVAGVAALLLQANPDLTASQVEDLLKYSADPTRVFLRHPAGAGGGASFPREAPSNPSVAGSLVFGLAPAPELPNPFYFEDILIQDTAVQEQAPDEQTSWIFDAEAIGASMQQSPSSLDHTIAMDEIVAGDDRSSNPPILNAL